MTKTAFEKIHNLNPTFNRLFSGPLYVISLAVVLLFFVLPYGLRIVAAFAINALMNRPIVYLNYFSRLISRPIGRVWMSVFYLVGLAPFAFATALRRRIHVPEPTPSRSPDEMRFQS